MQMATETVTDVSYFGTMMVHLGMADGMVSGAVHTTAHTIRPSFEIIKTAPGTKIVSSVFLMCLADRVLVYGDCAVNPDPTAPQLADIAISSAGTAEQFGIDPRVALLSYSTGTLGYRRGCREGQGGNGTRSSTASRPAGGGADPVRRRGRSDGGGHQDARFAVAGRATVLIFPDLNTGNNTYKAVQRSANAVAIGPVLQGLNKPVNDLSRGALVADIVNTVAITAVQAQGTWRWRRNREARLRSIGVMTTFVLVINSGSSSMKYQLIDPAEGRAVAPGLIERIGGGGRGHPQGAAASSTLRRSDPRPRRAR